MMGLRGKREKKKSKTEIRWWADKIWMRNQQKSDTVVGGEDFSVFVRELSTREKQSGDTIEVENKVRDDDQWSRASNVFIRP